MRKIEREIDPLMVINKIHGHRHVCLKGRKEIAWGNAPGKASPIRSSPPEAERAGRIVAHLQRACGGKSPSSWGVAPGYFLTALQAVSHLAGAQINC